MINIHKQEICISLNPNLFILKKTITEEEIIFKASELLLIVEEIEKNPGIKILFHCKLLEIVEYINLFNYYQINDPVLITLSSKIGNFERIKIDLIYDAKDINELFQTTDEKTKKIISNLLEIQYVDYHNTIIYSKESSIITINEMNYYKTHSLDTDVLNINSIKESELTNYEQLLPIIQWYFDKSFKNSIHIALSVINKINILSVSFHSTIISIFRGIYHPNYLLSSGSIQDSIFVVECHHSNSTRDLCKVSKHSKIGTYRVHVVSELGIKTSAKDRVSYIKNFDNYIVVGITNEHDNPIMEKDFNKIEAILSK